MELKISVVIVNWNGGVLIQECLYSLLSSEFDDYEVIIVDNASSDNSLDILPNNPKVKIVKLRENLGFAKACNIGADLSKGDYLLFLNPDTKVFHNTLKDSSNFMEKNLDITILGVKNVDISGQIDPSCARFPSLKRFFYDIIGLSKVSPKLFPPPTLMTDWNHEDSCFVNQVIGAFFFVRRREFEKIGKFDERFFVYYEEVDLSYRMAIQGYRTFYNSEIKVFHKKNGTTDQVKDKRLFYSLNSRLKYAQKHFSKFDYLTLKFLTLFVEPISRTLFFMFKFDFASVRQSMKGYKLLYKELFSL